MKKKDLPEDQRSSVVHWWTWHCHQGKRPPCKRLNRIFQYRTTLYFNSSTQWLEIIRTTVSKERPSTRNHTRVKGRLRERVLHGLEQWVHEGIIVRTRVPCVWQKLSDMFHPMDECLFFFRGSKVHVQCVTNSLSWWTGSHLFTTPQYHVHDCQQHQY